MSEEASVSIKNEEKNEISNKEQSSNTPEENKEIIDDGEQMRLGGHKPLYTILVQSIGPLLQQIVSATYGIVDTYFVGRALGKDGLAAIGSAATFEFISYGLAGFLAVSTASRLGYLYGQKRNEECAQVVCDMFRFAILYSIVCAALLLSLIKPFVRWMGASEDIVTQSFYYILPHGCGCIINDFYMIICGILQSEGRSYLYGVCQVCSLLLNMVLFDPLFLLKLKFGIWGASLASIIASFLPLFGLSFPLWMGKFTVKPKFSMFFNKFSKETWGGLKVGVSSLIGQLSGSLPTMLIQKYMGTWGKAKGIFNEVTSSHNVLIRVVCLITAVDTSLAQGLLPCTSFAFGANRINRLMWLSVHDLWMGTLWNLICAIVIITNSKGIAGLFVEDPNFIDYAAKYMSTGLISIFLVHSQFVCSVLLQATKQPKYASIQSLATQFFPIPVFSTIIYFTDKSKEPYHLIWAFVANDVFSFLLCIVFTWWRLGFIFKEEPSGEAGIANNKYEDDIKVLPEL